MSKKTKICLNTKKAVKHLFTPYEDNHMRQLVSIYGTKAWKIISKQMKDRTARQCRERWKNYLSPSVRNAPWVIEEDKLLIDLVNVMGTQWAKISNSFDSRTDTNVKNRYLLLQRLQNKKTLSDESRQSSSGQEQASSPEFVDAQATCTTDQSLMHSPEQNYSIEEGRCLMIDFWDQNQWEFQDDKIF